jgi:hypothetical protein
MNSTDLSYDLKSADLHGEGDQRCRNANSIPPSQGEGRVGSAEGRSNGIRAGEPVWHSMIHQWKRLLLNGASELFDRGGKRTPEVDTEQVKELH